MFLQRPRWAWGKYAGGCPTSQGLGGLVGNAHLHRPTSSPAPSGLGGGAEIKPPARGRRLRAAVLISNGLLRQGERPQGPPDPPARQVPAWAHWEQL